MPTARRWCAATTAPGWSTAWSRLDEIKDLTGLPRLPGEDSGDFQTLGGFLMARINRVPKVGDRINVQGIRFEVVDMDGRRVDRVLITPPKPAARR